MSDTFILDRTDPLAVAKFPEDFADWLLDLDREAEGREFLEICKHLRDITPPQELDESIFIEAAEEFAPVAIISDEENERPAKQTFAQMLQLLRDAEEADEPTSDSTPLPFDREAALINQTLADSSPEPSHSFPVDMDEHEYEDVTVWVDDDDEILNIVAHTPFALAANGYPHGAKDFCQDLHALTSTREPTSFDLFVLVWSYVDVLPRPGSERAKIFLEANYS